MEKKQVAVCFSIIWGTFPSSFHLIQWDSLRPWPMEGQDSERWVHVLLEDLLQATALF